MSNGTPPYLMLVTSEDLTVEDCSPEGTPRSIPHLYSESAFLGSRMLWLQIEGCIYSCRHPLWKGEGRCQPHEEDASKYECLCDPGYISTDSLGNPSCVPVSVLIAVYFAIAVTEALALAFLVRSWRKQGVLPIMLRTTRRAGIRRRLIAAVG